MSLGITGLALLLQGCSPKHSSEQISVRIVATPPLARHIAADLIQEKLIYEDIYEKVYTVEGMEYTVFYIPYGKPGVYEDDALIIQPGKSSRFQYMDVGVLGGISYVVSLKTETTIPYEEIPRDMRKGIKTVYLDSLLTINAVLLETENIKALEAIVPP